MGSGERPGVRETFERFRPSIERYLEPVGVDFDGTADFSMVEAELAVVFGGDGAILRSARQMGQRQRPVLAVNLGTLGFLASVHSYELIDVLKSLDLKRLPIVKHLMLECQIWRGQAEEPEQSRLCLNEVIAFRGDDSFRIMSVALSVDGLPVTTFRCDGLILSTPVGSTAHNLSAGGPILRKDLDAIVITPISPHSLSHRPVVDSADRAYTLRGVGLPAKIVVDGATIATLEPSDRAVIRRANVAFCMIETLGHSYYATLREKLGWSGQPSGIEESDEPPV